MRLIDADRLLSDRMKKYYYHLKNGDIAIPIIDIEHAPTIDAVSVVHGEWIDKGNWMGIECSRCKCHSRYVTPFCPQCGARMKTEDNERDYERAIEQMLL